MLFVGLREIHHESLTVKFAAMEGQFKTQRHAPLRIGGWPDTEAHVTRYAVEIPGGLSVLAARDPAAVEPDLRELSAVSRRTLTEARRLVTQFRGVSLAIELETAVTLLSAAGIDARVELPPTPLPSLVDEEIRASLRREVAALLAGRGAGTGVTIAVVSDGAHIRLETRPADAGPR